MSHLARSARVVSWLAAGALALAGGAAHGYLPGEEGRPGGQVPVPESVVATAPARVLVVGETVQLAVRATFAGGEERDVTAGATGTQYSSNDPTRATVDADGLVTGLSPGDVLLLAFHEGVEAEVRLTVVSAADRDDDRVPDAYELAHGADPTDPADAGGDADRDRLTLLEEHLRDTDPRRADTDGDGVADGDEIARGRDPLVSEAGLAAHCQATALNRMVQVSPGGGFALGNVPVPVGAFRVRVVCDRTGQVDRGHSAFVRGVPRGVTPLGPISFAADEPIPVSLHLNSPATVLSAQAPGAQLVATGVLVDGVEVDLTLADSGTFYLSSNRAIATVSADGFVNAVSSGNFLVTAMHEGSIATIALRVNLTDDADADGLPDDYERLNGFNPGGVNLARAGGVTVTASSAAAFGPAVRAIDGNLQTAWFTSVGDAANRGRTPFIEVAFPSAQSVAQVRLLGPRPAPSGSVFIEGIVQAFDGAGAEIFNSGPIGLPPPTRDRSVPLDLDGVRRIRFTSTLDQSNTPGLAELEAVSRPGGPALDPGNPADAAQDFDFDGLTNRQEFTLGTNPFSADTDADGLADAAELPLGSSPVRADTDNDGLADGQELSPGTDFDGDGVRNVLDADSDNDGLPDGIEVRLRLNPLNQDSNFNGIPDGSEDSDFDGLSNLVEVLERTDPGNRDTDGDGIADGEEVVAGQDGHLTHPLRADTDRDGMGDGWEVRFGFDPNDPDDGAVDADGDGLTNLQEFLRGSDPLNADAVSPAVAEVSPGDGTDGVPINSVVVVRFTEPLLSLSVMRGVVRLAGAGGEVPGNVALSSDRLFVTFTPGAPLEPLASYTVTVFGVRDLASNPMAAPFNSAFATGSVADTVRPFVVGTNPAAGLAEVPVNAPVAVHFSERMNPALLVPANFRLRDDTTFTDVPAAMIQVEPDGRTASFIPLQPLAVARQHSIVLGSGLRDVAGNLITGPRLFTFLTALRADGERPILLAVSPPDGALAVPLDARIALAFDEPIDAITAPRGIEVTRGGEPVPGSVALSDGNRRATFTPASPLAVQALYQVTVTTVITDLIGQPLANPGSFSFDTAGAPDAVAPTAVIDPAGGSVEVPTDAVLAVTFSEVINPTTVTSSTLRLFHQATGAMLEGGSNVPGGRQATFTPAAPLLPGTTYRFEVTSGVTDLAGRALVPAASTFVTAAVDDSFAPAVLVVSPPDGASEVPVNARITALVSEPVAAASVSAGALTVTAGGLPVAGVLGLSGDRRRLSFTPAAPLLAGAVHGLAIGGFTDLAGNPVASVTTSFTTSPGGAADAEGPTVVAVSPPDGATFVPVTAAVEWTFSEPVDPTTVGPESLAVLVDLFGVAVPGTYAVDGAVVTFMPGAPMPGGARLRPVVFDGGVADLAGNGTAGFESVFDTTAAADGVPPQVLSVAPFDGATEVGPSAQVVLTFTEPLDPATLDNQHFALFAEGEEVFAGVNWTSDTRTVTLSTGLPPGVMVTVVVSDQVRDLAGNRLEQFVSRFETAADFDGTRPAVGAQRPGNGASGVAPGTSIVLFSNERLDEASLDGALFVAQDGALVDGTVQVTGNGRTIEFLPAAPWLPDALVEVFLTASARDRAGNRLTSHHGLFTIAPDPRTTPPAVVRAFPMNQTGVPLNVVVELETSEPLSPASVSSLSVSLRQNTAGQPGVSATISLERDGRVIRIVPLAPLAPATAYFAEVTTGIRDLDGQGPAAVFTAAFTTGPAEDLDPPLVVAVSPPDGVAAAGVNAHVRVLFDEPINPVSIDGTTIMLADGSAVAMPCTISFGDGFRDVLVVPHAPLAADRLHTLRIEGVTDAAGNPVLVSATNFTTGDEPDTAAPQVLRTSPSGEASDAPVNAPIVVELDEAVDPGTVRAATLPVENFFAGQTIDGTYSISADGRRITFVPSAPFDPGQVFEVRWSNLGIEDLAGNRLTGQGFAFVTLDQPDTAAPLVEAISPRDGWTAVPANGHVVIRFDEPVSALSIDGVTLSEGGVPLRVKRRVSDGNRFLTLIPTSFLAPFAPHTLEVAGITDLAGNPLAGPVAASFTSSARVDLERPFVAAVDPPDGTVAVDAGAAVTVTFSEPLAPAWFFDFAVQVAPPDDGGGGGGEQIVIEENGDSGPVNGTLILAEDGRSATFTPSEPLADGHYEVTTDGTARDLTDRGLDFFSSTFRVGVDLAPPVVVAVSPPDGALDVPVNAVIAVRLSEPIDVDALGPDVIRVSGPSGDVAGFVDFESDERLLFRPDADLATATTYTVEVDGFTDLAGNPVVPASFSFTTAAVATPDQTPPTVASVDPPDGADEVPLTSQITLTFSEDLDPTTVGDGSIAITSGFIEASRAGGAAAAGSASRRRRDAAGRIPRASHEPVPGSFAVVGSVVIFTPEEPLPEGDRIAVSVSFDGVKDLAGNGLEDEFDSQFFTAGGGG